MSSVQAIAAGARVPYHPDRPRRRGLGSTLILCCALTGWAAPATGQSVLGTVVDGQTGRPVGAALLTLRSGDDAAVAATVGDAQGRFQLPDADPGTYRLHVEALGYEAFRSDPVRVAAGEPVEVTLRLTAAPIPIRGVEVSNDVVNRRIRDFVGMSPGLLRLRPIRANTISDQAAMGRSLSDVIERAAFPNLEVLRTRDGPCYRFRGRGCLPIYLDGARLNRSWGSVLPLEMVHTVVVVLPTETVAFPEGAVHVLTRGVMR